MQRRFFRNQAPELAFVTLIGLQTEYNSIGVRLGSWKPEGSTPFARLDWASSPIETSSVWPFVKFDVPSL